MSHEREKEDNSMNYLGTLRCSDGEGKEFRVDARAIHTQICKACSMALDGLAHASLPAVELHAAFDLCMRMSAILGRSSLNLFCIP